MKQIIFYLTVIVFAIKPIYAQNYQTINSRRITYFISDFKLVKSIRIDSVKYHTDSILYPFTVIQEVDFNCYSPWVASWIGPRVLISKTGMNYFFNRKNDTIKIQTKARLNDKWIAFYFEDSSFVEASVIKHDTMNFLNLNDSVKSIGFHVYDKIMNPLEHDINQMTIQISKNYGLVKTLNFYLFPDDETFYSGEDLTEYYLAGLSDPKTGIQNITWYDVNDFQPDDELHILKESMYYYGDGMRSITTDKAIYKYLDRTDYEDSIVYQYSLKESVYRVWEDTSSFLFIYDTLTSVIKPDPDFDKLPGEPVFTDYSMFSYYITGNSKTDPRELDAYFNRGDSCWFLAIVDGCLNYYTYLKGLGGPYYSCLSSSWMERNLVYYRKGETTWGTPLVVTGIRDVENDRQFRVYPNPAKDQITVRQQASVNGRLIFALFDLNGRIILKEEINEFEEIINIENIKPGVYLYRIMEKDKTVHLNKLVIE